ncbi:hypothetical protein EVAR_27513_1 [Eumeta japonica]|uniref:Uncharacterized protein n=1 Tax=Eumeta variegata TaxID=151549 RepID=A0A4C1XCQ2_EUMVA|nr:hypothetical protein EVAR_27513_1 [Eumeta japonica]
MASGSRLTDGARPTLIYTRPPDPRPRRARAAPAPAAASGCINFVDLCLLLVIKTPGDLLEDDRSGAADDVFGDAMTRPEPTT